MKITINEEDYQTNEELEAEKTDTALIEDWRYLWDEAEAEGGQSSDATGFIAEALREVEQEIRARGLRPEYGRCSYAPNFCPYGCPDSKLYWD